MLTPREHIGKALERLTIHLQPYVEGELRRFYKNGWMEAVSSSFRSLRGNNRDANDKTPDAPTTLRWDAHSLLTVMWDQWNAVFRESLGHFERSLVSELRDFRNRWAHQEVFTFDDAWRVLDTCERLLTATGCAPIQEFRQAKNDLQHVEFSRRINAARENTKVIRKRWINIAVYTGCCATIVATLNYLLTAPTSWIFSVAATMMCMHLVRQELVEQPRLIGPHECRRCRRVVYSESCPYCEAGGR